jgi:hypothetical protein
MPRMTILTTAEQAEFDTIHTGTTKRVLTKLLSCKPDAVSKPLGERPVLTGR